MTEKQTISCYNVLLVEDELLIMNSIERNIISFNNFFKVCGKCPNGTEALKFLKDSNIHLVITDIQMPVMDGLSLAKKIHEKYPHILTIVMTGYAEFDYARRALKSGVVDYLLKPINPEELEDSMLKAKLQLDTLYSLEEEMQMLGKDARQIVEYVTLYIRENYMKDIDFSSLSLSMGFSSSYLTKLFNKYNGESPLKYLTNIRIHEAKRLLIDTSLPIQKVGELVGYPDQFHFSKTFRKLTGVNPTSYRKSNA